MWLLAKVCEMDGLLMETCGTNVVANGDMSIT